MKKISCLLVSLTFLASLAFATQWVSLKGTDELPVVKVIESSENQILLNYQLGGFVKDQVMINGEQFDLIALKGESRLWNKGNPELPRLCRSVIIPDDALMQASIVSAEYTDLENVRVTPSKGHFSRSVNPEDVPFEFGAVYHQDAWYPEQVVQLRDPYILRDFRGQVVEVNAFQYNPVQQVLRVYTNLTIEVKQVGIGGENVFVREDSPSKLDREFQTIYKRRFINFDDERYTPVEEDGSMLIICHADFMDEMEPFVDWKNQKGLATTIVNVSQIGNNATAIKNYIRDVYNTSDLKYVLLVGDAAQVATPSGSTDPTYAQLVGTDHYPEIFVGRFSAEQASHVITQVERSVEYEKLPQAGADWYHKGAGVASDQGAGQGHYGEADWEHMDLIRADLLRYTYTEVDRIYDPWATQADISNALNEGRSTINYCGHGSTTSWSTTGFSNTSVNNLVNDNKLPFNVTVACLCGSFASTTCFAEAWLRATHNGEPTGAIGFFASTISQSWAPPMYAEDEFIDLMCAELKNTYGGLCFNGTMLMIDETGGTGENEADHWTVFGDPSLQVRTDTPFNMTVSHDNQIDPNNPTFEVVVTGIEGALCAISYEGEMFGSAYTNATGLASIPIIPGTLPPGYVTLTVTSYNAMPYFAQLPVMSGGPDLWPPLIAHTPLPNTTGTGPYTVVATIMDYSGVAEATLYYSTDGINYNDVAMVNTIGDTWEAGIPGQTPGTTVSYYIEAVDASPQSNVGTSATFSFLVLAILFADDMESGIGGWTHDVVTPGWVDQWHLSSTNSHSPTHAWKFGDTGAGNYADHADGGLVSQVITIGSDCELSFWHWIAAEASGAYADSAYDGGVVEISQNGVTWSVLPLSPGYTHYIRATAGGGNPYTGPFPAGMPCFSGTANWMMQTADLSAYVGDIQLRFRFGSDNSTNNAGWYVDDVQIIGLPTGTTPELNVELTYVSGSPVPAAGGNLYYAVFVENAGTVPLNFDAWIDIAYEGGPPTTVLQRSFTNYLPGWTINRPNVFFPVPGSYAAGNYTLTGRVGIHPSVIWNESGFPWSKAGDDALIGFAPWIPDGVPNPFEEVIANAGTPDVVPESFTLNRLYPNPFNPTTTFTFALPEVSQVKLAIYNLQGQLIATLVDGLRDAGTHDVTFDASNLASGIYLYRLNAAGHSLSGKMMLIK